MFDPAAAYVNVTGAFPNVVGVDASGPSTTDGFEFIAAFVNDNNLGQAQMLLDHAGLTPTGVVESASVSQVREALWKGFSGHPGMVTHWHNAATPAVAGHRCLPLNGQGILRANYVDLDTAVYVGDANNAAVAAAGGGYYRADDAAGTIPNIVGIYLILPESRGYVARGLDVAAAVDPDGASRYLGDIQTDTFQGHRHKTTDATGAEVTANPQAAGTIGGAGGHSIQRGSATAPYSDLEVKTPVFLGAYGTPRISTETRIVNFSTNFVIWY